MSAKSKQLSESLLDKQPSSISLQKSKTLGRNGQRDENARIQFDELNDTRALNYVEDNSKDASIALNTDVFLKFSLKSGTYAISNDQNYAYLHVPDSKEIVVYKVPSFEPLGQSTRYTLPPQAKGVKILLLDDFS